MHTLSPTFDLLRRINSQSGASKEITTTIEHHHLKDDREREVVDPEEAKPFNDAGQHVYGKKKIITDLFDAMSNAIMEARWDHFNEIFLQLKKFHPTQNDLNCFGQSQIKILVSLDFSLQDMEILYQNLEKIGVDSKALNIGMQQGYDILHARRN